MTGAPHGNGLDVIEKEYKKDLVRIEELEARVAVMAGAIEELLALGIVPPYVQVGLEEALSSAPKVLCQLVAKWYQGRSLEGRTDLIFQSTNHTDNQGGRICIGTGGPGLPEEGLEAQVIVVDCSRRHEQPEETEQEATDEQL